MTFIVKVILFSLLKTTYCVSLRKNAINVSKILSNENT